MTWDWRLLLPFALSLVLVVLTVRACWRERSLFTLLTSGAALSIACFMLVASVTPSLSHPWSIVYWVCVAGLIAERLVAVVRWVLRTEDG